MVLTIKNFESQNVGPGVVETAPTNLVGVAGTLKATLTWTSATGESGVTWTEEKLVRKEGSAPSNSLDGTVVTTITTKDTYATNGYVDKGLSSETTYYYGVFAIYDNGTERGITTSVTTNVMTTATIRWNEVSNPEDFFLEYLDDADGGVQGSTEFDKFFEYKPVLLNASGVETAQLNPNDFSKDTNGNSVNITSGDNVMIKFPTLGVKMSKNGSTVTLSLTKELNKTGYQYYAHQNGSLSSPGAVQSAFYLGAYDAYNNSGTLKSWSGKSPTVEQIQATFCTQAKANGTGYNIMGFYQRQFVNALYMMKYGNPNSQSVIGQGYTGGSDKQNTGATNTVGMTGATNTSNTGRIKLFGLEDRRGNLFQRTGGIYINGSRNLYVQLSGYSGNTSGGESTGITLPLISGNITSVQASNKGMFAPSSASGSTYTTQYCDGTDVKSSRLVDTGGSRESGARAGAFIGTLNQLASDSNEVIGSRLQYLPA